MDTKRLTEYLRIRMPEAQDLAVVDFKRIPGGSSRETYSFDLQWTQDGERRSRPLIGRRDPTGGLLKTEREREYKIVDAVFKAGLKVPEPLFLEMDASTMDRPFFIMHRERGRTGYGYQMALEPPKLREKLADDFLTELAGIQALDWRAMGLDFLGVPEPGEGAARIAAEHWSEIYEKDRLDEHYPILDAAFAWLRTNPVSTDRITLVHGDFRSGNYLFDENGIIAMLDWEMAHLGDPMEDLGWTTMPLWGTEQLAGGLIDRDEFCRLYEKKTGTRVDQKRLTWYQILGNAKMAVICLTGICDFTQGRTSDMTMPMLTLILPVLLGELGKHLSLL